MKFGEVPVDEAVGAVLAHSLKAGERSLRKGRVLSAEDVAALKAAGRRSIIAAQLEPGDIDENAAAAELARPLAGHGVSVAAPFTGRVNLFAQAPGLLVFERTRIDRFNLVDETITLATIEPYAVVAPKQMVATVKVIPFAVRRNSVAACLEAAAEGGPLFAVAPFREKRAALIQTRLPGLKESILDKTVEATRDRLVALSSALLLERRCEHRVAALAPEIAAAIAAGAELVLIAGASAIVDRRDVIPAAIAAAGGVIEHFGMPVDPGNLMLMGRHGGVPVLGLPGCARSPKVNGFDWVLQRLLAELPVGSGEIMRMGVGGLLADIPTRPLPRAKVAAEAAKHAPRIAGLVLAAGQSRRMGTLNKLLIGIDGKPMVRHVAEAVAASQASPLVVVTGHQREKVEAALAGLGAQFVHNPDYAQGLSTSVKSRPCRAARRGRRRRRLSRRHAHGYRRRHRPADRRLQPGRGARPVRSHAPRQARQPGAAGQAAFRRARGGFRRCRRPRPHRRPSRAGGRGRDGERCRAHRHRHAAGVGQARGDGQDRRLKYRNKSRVGRVVGKTRRELDPTPRRRHSR